ncbi:MAG: cysteine desulfurase family protein [Flavobacteriaceae bacterium]
MQIYFDNAATTPLRLEVIDSISSCLLETFGNPSSTHTFGRKAKTAIEAARKNIAKQLHAVPSEIIFTSGGTESDNMVLCSAVQGLGVQRIITSPIEHHAVLHVAQELAKQNCLLDYVLLDADGNIDLDHLEALLRQGNQKTLVSLMHVNNEVGNFTDLYQVGNLCKQYDALFHTDAVQGVGHFELNLDALPVDFLSASAHKFHGPKGVGILYIKKNIPLQSLLKGGSQERGLRAGTEAVQNIVGMDKALGLAHDNFEKEHRHILGLKTHFLEQLRSLFPEAQTNGLSGDLKKSTYTLVNLSLPIKPEKAQMLDFHLDLKGIACSRGSACQSGSNKGSHVIEALQRSPKYVGWPTLRFSFSYQNTTKEIDYLMDVLTEFNAKS